MRKFLTIAGVLGASWLFIGSIHAADGSSAATPLEVYLRRETVEYAEPYYQAYITAGAVKFAFLLPQGFMLMSDGSKGEIMVSNKEGNCSATFAVIGSASDDSGELHAETYREYLLKQHPSARIVGEFTGRAGGRSGPGFDLQWKAAGDIIQRKRVVFIPSAVGVLQFTAVTGRDNFPAAEASLGTILSTFSYAKDGKLKIHHLSSKS